MLCNGWDKINLYLILMPTIGSIFHVQITVTEITELKDICPGDIRTSVMKKWMREFTKQRERQKKSPQESIQLN